jgi:hypothetical protein
MLGMKTYPKNYIDACRARVDADLRAYRKQVGKTSSREFEGRFFNNQVILLAQVRHYIDRFCVFSALHRG